MSQVDWQVRYSDQDRQRWVPEPDKRVPAPERTPFERDRARVVHSASLRRLAAKTQVLGPQADDFVRNRLTHSIEVAQIARDLAHPLGCHPDLAETAAFAHDLGHPPFGHGGEAVLDELAQPCGGFEGNAQTLRILTRLEAKTHAPDGSSAGLNLTRATLDACIKYPWKRSNPLAHSVDSRLTKFGVYPDDLPVFEWLREPAPPQQLCIEAQIMDIADDIGYSVHDLEDGIVSGRIDISQLEAPAERAAVWETVRQWYLPDVSDAALEAAWEQLVRVVQWPPPRYRYDGTRRALAGLKNLTSDLIGVFCGAVFEATSAVHGHPLLRYRGQLVVPSITEHQIAVLKGIAAHYVMSSQERVEQVQREQELLAELFAVLVNTEGELMTPQYRQDFDQASDDAARLRVIVDQLAVLTDDGAVAWHRQVVKND